MVEQVKSTVGSTKLHITYLEHTRPATWANPFKNRLHENTIGWRYANRYEGADRPNQLMLITRSGVERPAYNRCITLNWNYQLPFVPINHAFLESSKTALEKKSIRVAILTHSVLSSSKKTLAIWSGKGERLLTRVKNSFRTDLLNFCLHKRIFFAQNNICISSERMKLKPSNYYIVIKHL